MKIPCCIYLSAALRYLPHNVTSLQPRGPSLWFTHHSHGASQRSQCLGGKDAQQGILLLISVRPDVR